LQDMEKRHFTQIFHLHWDKVNNSLNAWTYYTKVSSPSPWCKLNNFCPSFKISLCEVNLSFNLVLKSFQNKVSINQTPHPIVPCTIPKHDLITNTKPS
jgi:hypothetical protein